MYELGKYDEALYYEIFKSWEYSFLDDFIKKAKLVFDVGWHIWYFSLYCLEKKPKLQVHFFEPVKDYFLQAKITLEEHSNNIVWNNQWVRKKNESKELYINPVKTMQSSLFNTTTLNNSKDYQMCEFISLKDYILDNNISTIDILKMDIEWSEFDVLLSLRHEILSKVKVLFYEYHIFDANFQNKHEKLIVHLKQYYKKIEIISWKYSKDYGYILAYN